MSENKKTVYVVYYSMYGHIKTLANEILAGLQKSGVHAKLFQVAETLPENVLEKMHAPPKDENIPIIEPGKLAEADGIIFGMPTRFGMVPAQMKALFDSCGQLWYTGGLRNRFVGTFFSTGALGAGQETTAFTCLPFFAHMGMIYVTFGGGKFKGAGDNSQVHGGSAYGTGTLANDRAHGDRQPSELELEAARAQGEDFGKIVNGSNFER